MMLWWMWEGHCLTRCLEFPAYCKGLVHTLAVQGPLSAVGAPRPNVSSNVWRPGEGEVVEIVDASLLPLLDVRCQGQGQEQEVWESDLRIGRWEEVVAALGVERDPEYRLLVVQLIAMGRMIWPQKVATNELRHCITRDPLEQVRVLVEAGA